MFKLRLLRLSHWKLIVFEAVPKLRDKREAFGRRQTDDLVGAEQFHAFSLRENQLGGKAACRMLGILNP